MQTLSIYMARYLPILGILLHLEALWLWWALYSPVLGLKLVWSAWGLFFAYAVIFGLTGDFIQHAFALGGSKNDELQVRQGGRVSFYAHSVVFILLVLIVGSNYYVLMIGKGRLSAEEIAAAGQIMYLMVTLVAYLAGVLPTCILGWKLNPLPADEAEAT